MQCNIALESKEGTERVQRVLKVLTDKLRRLRNAVLAAVCCCLILPVLVSAQPADRDGPIKLQQQNQRLMAPESARRISNRQAASLVKQRYGASKILGISLLNDSGPPVYRVRTLSPDGVVKSVFVDGRTGEVFE